MAINMAQLLASGQIPPGLLAQMQGSMAKAQPLPGQNMMQPQGNTLTAAATLPVNNPVTPGTPLQNPNSTPGAPVALPNQPPQLVQHQSSGGHMAAPQQALPQTGLIGSEAALQGGASASIDALMQGYNQATAGLGGPVQAPTVGPADMSQVNSAIGQGINQATQYLQHYAQTGQQAFDQQAALSGAMGADAQREAYANFNESPGQQYLRSRAEQALLRNSAALGGLGGGRVRQELQRQAIGEAAQDFNNSYNRLGSVAQSGLAASGQQAGITGQLRGQQAGIAGSLEGQRMGIQGQLQGQQMSNEMQRRMQLANLASTTGQNAAQIAYNTGTNLASGRTGAGNQIAGAVGGTVSALANLANQQGQGISDTIGNTAGDLANIISGAGQQQATSQQNLATILANIASGQGSQVASLPGIPGVQETGGILGNVGNFLSGVGTLLPQNR